MQNDPFKTTSSDDQLDEKLKSLVGENGKYKTQDEALKALVHAQDHIKKLEEDNGTLRTTVETTKTVEEILRGMQQKQETPSNETPEETPSDSQDSDTNIITDDNLRNLIRQHFEEQKNEEKTTQNYQSAINKAAEIWGDKLPEVVQKRATELGVSAEFLQSMAKQSPKAFLDLLGSTDGKADNLGSNLNSDVNTTAFSNYNKQDSSEDTSPETLFGAARLVKDGKMTVSDAIRRGLENPEKFFQGELDL